MANNTQFAIAVHLLAGLGNRSDEEIVSAQLAYSVNTSPSFVRRILSKLSKAGLVQASTGKGGACRLARGPEAISLLDVYRAVDAPKAFALHSYEPAASCKVSCNIKTALTHVLDQSQTALEDSLARMTVADVIKQLNTV